MKDKMRTNYEESQMAGWRNSKGDVISFFNRFSLDVNDLWQHAMNCDYDKAQVIAYLLLGKMTIAIEICDFLDTLTQRDVDVIKLYILISHAEIASRSFGHKGRGTELVRKFFEPMGPDLKHKIKTGIPLKERNQRGDFAHILYKVRCEYVHEGNYTGVIFKRDNNSDSFRFSFKDGNKKLLAECAITYKEFLEIYMKALIENVKIFSTYPKKQ